jgi:hypothetical protein
MNMAPTLDQLRSEVWAWPARSSQVRASWTTSSFERKKDLTLFWCSRPDEGSEETDREGDDRVDDEHPSPARESVEAVEMRRRGRLQQAGCQCSCGKPDVEDSASSADLISSVPRPEHVVDSWEVCALEQAK